MFQVNLASADSGPADPTPAGGTGRDKLVLVGCTPGFGGDRPGRPRGNLASRGRPFLTFGGSPPKAGSSRRDRRGGAYPGYDGHAVEAESAGGRDSRPQAPQQIREVTSAPATSYASSLSVLGVFTGNDTTGTGESTLSNSSRRAW